MTRQLPRFLSIVVLTLFVSNVARGDRLIPPWAGIRSDRPRLLIRPKATPYAISLDQLAALPRDRDFLQMLQQLKGQHHAKSPLMVKCFCCLASRGTRSTVVMRIDGHHERHSGQVLSTFKRRKFEDLFSADLVSVARRLEATAG